MNNTKDLVNEANLIKLELQLMLINRNSVTALYEEIKTYHFKNKKNNMASRLFHLSTFTRYLNSGKISKNNLEILKEFLFFSIQKQSILELYFSQFPKSLSVRKLILNIFNNPDLVDILCYHISIQIKQWLNEQKTRVDYLLTFPDVLPMASLLGPRYLNIPYISLLTYKPPLEDSISVDYRIEKEVVRTYHIPLLDLQPNKSYGVILDYVEYGNLSKMFFELIRKPEIKGEIKFLIVLISVGNIETVLDDDLNGIFYKILYSLPGTK